MLFSFLLALTLSPEKPLAELRIGSPPQYVRAVSGVAPTAGGGWLTAWSNGTSITMAPIGVDGQPSEIRKGIPGIDAALASTARGPILLWTASNGIFAAPLASDGSFAGPASQVALFATQPISLACNATRCIAGMAFNTAILDAEARVISTSDSPDRIAAVAADPDGFLAVRSLNSGLRAERLDPSGAVTATASIPDASATALADFDGAQYAILYTAKESTTGDLLGVTFATDGTLSKSRTVYHPPVGFVSEAAIAWNGSEHLLAVSDITEVGVGIEGTIWPSTLSTQRLDRDLAPLAPAAVLFSGPRSNYSPRAATGGGKFFVAWQHIGVGSSVRGAQFAGGNTVQSVLTLGPLSQLSPAIAAADERDIALWIDRDDVENKVTLFERRFPDDLVPLILAEGYDIVTPAAASIGSDWLVVWRETQRTDLEHPLLKGAIVSPFFADVQRINFGINGLVEGIASGANGWVVLVSTGGKVQSIRVTRAAQVMPAADVFAAAVGKAAIASNGANFIAAVADGNSGVRLALLDANGLVTATGHLDAPNSFAVALTSARRDFVIATAGTGGTSFWRVGSSLANPVLTGHVSGSDPLLKLVPFGSGSLATWGPNALRLDASGVPIGAPTVFSAPILAVAPHGTMAMAIFSRRIAAFPIEAQQLFVREIVEPDVGRRRALR